MKSTLRQIGYSRGVIIPAPLLVECGIEDEIELTLESGRLVICPIKPARAGWFDSYQADKDESVWTEMVETAQEQEDWQW